MNPKQVVPCSIVAALVLWLSTAFLFPDAARTSAQGMGFGQLDLIRQLKNTDVALKLYARSHDHFPGTNSEFDDLLKGLYKAISLSAPDTTVYCQSSGKFRTYYNLAIAVDSSFLSYPEINGQIQVPDSLNAPASTIVIFTDGASNAACWAAGNNGKPIVNPTTNSGYVFYRETIKTPTTPASGVKEN